MSKPGRSLAHYYSFGPKLCTFNKVKTTPSDYKGEMENTSACTKPVSKQVGKVRKLFPIDRSIVCGIVPEKRVTQRPSCGWSWACDSMPR